ncbi:MAG: hypothetical protein JWO82_1674, partial [Akkermansiaceae bacterium]|nr:hypothetical protein [Akkermansiaceae bacterium]
MVSIPPVAKSINYVFVDFENVHELDLSIIGEKEVVFTLMVGACQKKLDVELVEKLLECSASVKLIRLTSQGKNALDFALSYYAGRASATDPAGYIHIVLGDAGFDPLIEHLRSKGIKARRHDSFADLTFCGPPKGRDPVVDDPFERALAHFRKNITNRPKKKKTLLSHLTTQFANRLGESGISTLIDRLTGKGYLVIDQKEVVTY